MARDKIFDPKFQKAFTEGILKENDSRKNWFLKYGRQCKQQTGISSDYESDEDSECHGAIEAKIYLRDIECKRELPPKEERAWPMFKIIATETIPRVTHPPEVMKRVSSESKKLLYQGLSHDGEGRAMYLNHRYLKSPAERYRFPLTSSWEYGWGCDKCNREEDRD